MVIHLALMSPPGSCGLPSQSSLLAQTTSDGQSDPFRELGRLALHRVEIAAFHLSALRAEIKRSIDHLIRCEATGTRLCGSNPPPTPMLSCFRKKARTGEASRGPAVSGVRCPAELGLSSLIPTFPHMRVGRHGGDHPATPWPTIRFSKNTDVR